MPRYSRKSYTTRSMRGGSVMNWLRTKALPFIRTKALPFIKKHRLVSRGLQFAGKTLNKPAISTLGAAVRHTGYGRTRMYRRRGGALRMAGGALRG